MSDQEILEIELDQYYQSKSRKVLVRVTGFSRHGMDCSIQMIHYVNVFPTEDYPTGTNWVIDESMFLRRFETTVMQPVTISNLSIKEIMFSDGTTMSLE
jgi:hypothetical protein